MFKWLFGKKNKKRDKKLLAMYERGEYLRVNEDVDNKELMLQGGDVKEEVPEIKQVETMKVPTTVTLPKKDGTNVTMKATKVIAKPEPELLPHQKAEIDIRNKLKEIMKNNEKI